MASKHSHLAEYIFPTLSLIMGIVLLILYFRARKREEELLEKGIIPNGHDYRFWDSAQLNQFTTINI